MVFSPSRRSRAAASGSRRSASMGSGASVSSTAPLSLAERGRGVRGGRLRAMFELALSSCWQRSVVVPLSARERVSAAFPSHTAPTPTPRLASARWRRGRRSLALESASQIWSRKRRFAAEQMRAAGDVEKKPVRRIEHHDRREALAPGGDIVERARIFFRLGFDTRRASAGSRAHRRATWRAASQARTRAHRRRSAGRRWLPWRRARAGARPSGARPDRISRSVGRRGR